ncbi:MAG: SH3 domain-containing protein [Christensenellales bacterium]
MGNNCISKKIHRLSHVAFCLMIILIMLFVFCITEATSAKAEETAIGTAYCTAASKINLRSGPSTSKSIVGTLPAKATVNVYKISGHWYNIIYNGKNAWAHGNYLNYTAGTAPEITPPPTPVAETDIGKAVCTARTKINLRTGPGTSYQIVDILPGKTSVDIYEISGNWYRVFYNGKIVWGSADYLLYTPNNTLNEVQPVSSTGTESGTDNTQQVSERTYAIYYQGDRCWGYSRSVAKKACLLTAYAVVLKNMGLDATPKTVYQATGRSLYLNQSKIETTFGVRAVQSISADAPYFSSFDGLHTYIQSPSKNYIAAVVEALEKHPEGVLLYFKKGSKAHAIVACKVDGDTIYYSDPGRKRTTLLTYKSTWVSYKHRLSYGYLSYMITFDSAE